MRKRLFVICIALLLAFTVVFAACDEESGGVFNLDLSSKSIDALKSDAVIEKRVNALGLTRQGGIYNMLFSAVKSEYAVEVSGIAMSDENQLSLFADQAPNGYRDIGNVRLDNAKRAEKLSLTAKYKTTKWSTVPAGAKDDDGDWIATYLTTISFLSNTSIGIGAAPTSWRSMVDEGANYVVTIGDVTNSYEAQMAVLASAFAYGNGVGYDIQAALDGLWKPLAQAGRLDTLAVTDARIIDGSIKVAPVWDNYGVAMYYRSDTSLNRVTIPVDKTVQIGYATIINKYARHESAAALLREYALSDAYQTAIADAPYYLYPSRRVDIERTTQLKLISSAEYGANVVLLSDQIDIDAALAKVVEMFTAQILDSDF